MFPMLPGGKKIRLGGGMIIHTHVIYTGLTDDDDDDNDEYDVNYIRLCT